MLSGRSMGTRDTRSCAAPLILRRSFPTRAACQVPPNRNPCSRNVCLSTINGPSAGGGAGEGGGGGLGRRAGSLRGGKASRRLGDRTEGEKPVRANHADIRKRAVGVHAQGCWLIRTSPRGRWLAAFLLHHTADMPAGSATSPAQCGAGGCHSHLGQKPKPHHARFHSRLTR